MGTAQEEDARQAFSGGGVTPRRPKGEKQRRATALGTGRAEIGPESLLL